MAENLVAYAATYDEAEAAKGDYSSLREVGVRDIAPGTDADTERRTDLWSRP